MPNKMLIDATHPEETRVVVVRGNRVEEFDFETAQRKQLRGNIYLAKVTRVEPSLQAAFIEYGGNRHGFLAFSEIHPDYYQIPVADRQALIEADERAHREAEEESENRSNRRRPRHRNSRRRGNGERIQSEIVEHASADPSLTAQPHEGQEGQEHEGHAEHLHGESDRAHDSEHHHADAEHHEHDEQAHDSEHAHDEPDHAHHENGEIHASETLAAVTVPDTAAIEASAAAPAAAEPHEEHAHDERTDEEQARENAAHAEDGHQTEHADGEPAASDQAEEAASPHGDEIHDDEDEAEDVEEEVVESVGGDDVLEEVPERAFRPRRQYKIQEVIKRRQVMLVQVVKEERGNKGAALTTYLSLAGRYAVLMPNTARGGGISRKITSAQDRSRCRISMCPRAWASFCAPPALPAPSPRSSATSNI
jgi:ribonuclease E